MRLYINIDHVATVRQARRTDEPDPVRAAVLAELGGADGITVHLREDRRHIQDRDVDLLMRTVRTGVNLELAAIDGMLDLALAWKPAAVTLVPERREEITTEGGLDLLRGGERFALVVRALKNGGIRTAAFIGPDPAQIKEAAKLGFDAIEIHTGEYANSARGDREKALRAVRDGAAAGRKYGMAVHAGHGLTYHNVHAIVRIDEIEELNIGHSIISRAVYVGVERAVREMVELMKR